MGGFLTKDVAQERFRLLLDRVDAAYAEMRELSSDEVGNDFRVEVAERLETQHRTNRGLMYRVFGEIDNPPDETGCVPVFVDRLWARLRITRGEIKRRMKTAGQIRPRRSLIGPPLPAELPEVAAAVEGGELGEDHLRTILKAMKKLPSCVSDVDRRDVERSLVLESRKSDAEIVAAAAEMIDLIFNPDGDYDEADRERRRGLLLGKQGRDGMSYMSGWIDPETRAYVEAVEAAVRPGRHLPDHSVAAVPDDRSRVQRRHDGLKLGLKAGLASGALGRHRGHPVTVIVRTTLAELNQAAHAVHSRDIPMPPPARTGGDTALPMRDLIRMATDAIHYLAVFEEHSDRPIYLGRQKRIATVDQRIICYARDGGCTRPNCRTPGYECEVHHSPDWAAGGATDADCLYFACDGDHDEVTEGRLQTVVTSSGRLGWTDGFGPPEVNHAHHPEELLRRHPGDP